MECPNCKTSNPDGNRFCGGCGVRITSEPGDLRTILRDELPRQIEQAVEAKLSNLPDRNFVELKATEQVIERTWKWMIRFATVIGIAAIVVAIALGVWGVDSIQDLQVLRKKAEAKLSSAVTKAETIEAKADEATETFKLRIAESKIQAEAAKEIAEKANEALGNAQETVERYRAHVAEMEEKVREVDETVEQVKSLEEEVQNAIQETKGTVGEFNKRTQKLDDELTGIAEKVAGLRDMARQTADLATKIAETEGTEKGVEVLSDRVTARVRFDEAFSEEDPERKIALYTEAIELDSEFAFAYNNRGGAYSKKGDHDRAIADYDRAIELDPNDVVAYINRGTAYGDKDEYDRAIINYDRGIELDPNYVNAYINRGTAYYRKGNDDRAIMEYNRAIELDPNAQIAYVYRGNIYGGKGDHDRAIADYDRAIELNPDFFAAFHRRGEQMFNLGRFGEAERDLAKSVRLEPSNAYAVIWLYLAHARSGEPDEEALRADAAKIDMNKWPGPVISMYLGQLTPEKLGETARDQNPNTDSEQRCEANFYIAELRLMERRHEEAISLFRTAFETCPRTFTEYDGANAELQRLAAD